MNPAQLFGQSPAFPPRVGADGHVLWSSGEDNIRESIRIILLTEPGERLYRPEFGAGLGRYLFEPNVVATHVAIADSISRALGTWEPRIRVAEVEVVADPANAEAAIATLSYTLVATQQRERLSLSVALGGR